MSSRGRFQRGSGKSYESFGPSFELLRLGRRVRYLCPERGSACASRVFSMDNSVAMGVFAEVFLGQFEVRCESN